MKKHPIDRNIKQSLNRAIKNNSGFRWDKILGYSLEEIKEQLEKNFYDEMNWENYGEYWGITFFIPRRLYKFTTLRSEEFKKCWALKNLKPEKILNCYRQKKEINFEEIERNNLYDILPIGKLLTKKEIYVNIESQGEI